MVTELKKNISEVDEVVARLRKVSKATTGERKAFLRKVLLKDKGNENHLYLQQQEFWAYVRPLKELAEGIIFRGAYIVGPMGSGKTVFMRWICQKIENGELEGTDFDCEPIIVWSNSLDHGLKIVGKKAFEIKNIKQTEVNNYNSKVKKGKIKLEDGSRPSLKEDFEGVKFVVLVIDDAARHQSSREVMSRRGREDAKDFFEIRHILEEQTDLHPKAAVFVMFAVQGYMEMSKSMRNHLQMRIFKGLPSDYSEQAALMKNVGENYFDFLAHLDYSVRIESNYEWMSGFVVETPHFRRAARFEYDIETLNSYKLEKDPNIHNSNNEIVEYIVELLVDDPKLAEMGAIGWDIVEAKCKENFPRGNFAFKECKMTTRKILYEKHPELLNKDLKKLMGKGYGAKLKLATDYIRGVNGVTVEKLAKILEYPNVKKMPYFLREKGVVPTKKPFKRGRGRPRKTPVPSV